VTLKRRDGSLFTYSRDEICVTAHNLNIDVRFGLRIGADIWIDLCSMQFGFNVDPFLTKGYNGAKERVYQFFGIEYPSLRDICGPQHMGSFHKLTSLRTIMMYGCADVDLVREFTIRMVNEISKCSDYFGHDLLEAYMKYDHKYMNYVARNDYLGVRVNKEEAKKRYDKRTNLLSKYYTFMGWYYARVKRFQLFYSLAEALKQAGKPLSGLEFPDLDNIEPYVCDSWSGTFLLKTLFQVLDYPVLRTTQQRVKPGEKKKQKPPQPSVDTDAVRDYLKYPAIRSTEEIQAAIANPNTLEKLKLKSMYLEQDYLDPDTGDVLISKDVFNSKAYPFFLVLQKIAPLEKSVSSDLVPIVGLNSPYRFAESRTTTIVTRRVANSLCIVSKKEKDLYLPYTDDYYFCGLDQAAVEIRVANGLSEDESLINFLRDPEKDPHTETCVEFLGKPAYLVDKKTERGPIKAVNFGRVYEREVRSICDQLFEGECTPENLATVARMCMLYDEKRASVHSALNRYRDECYVVREVPEFIRFFLMINEFIPRMKDETDVEWEIRKNRKYGFMQNIFKFVQHVEIREEGWHKAAMRRKAGNFAVQGLCSTMFRILYTRFHDECWKRNWFQDKKVIAHFTVYDELDMSYHKSINGVELISVLRDTFIINFRKFPPLFIGVNITHNWGESKDDEYEIPIHLLNKLRNDYVKKGLYRDWNPEDHVQWFLDLNDKYSMDRLKEVIIKANGGRKDYWVVERLSANFDNYTVRSILMGLKKFSFPIKDWADPIEILLSALLPYISEYLLEDGEKALVVCRNRKIVVTKETCSLRFANEVDCLDHKPLIISYIDKDKTNDTVSEEMEYMSIDYFDFMDVDDNGDFNTYVPVAHVEKWDTTFRNDFYNPLSSEDLFNKSTGFINTEQYIKDALKPKVSYNNFAITAGKVIIDCKDIQHFTQIKQLCTKYYTTSGNSHKVYIRLKPKKFEYVCIATPEMLRELDGIMTEKFNNVKS